MLSETVLSFARYTITDRHFVYIEDGLKPSQRRILYAMYKDGLLHNKYRAKTFDILGSVSNYSPHGTQTLDGAMARLTNDTSLYPLIDGKGSFSSITSRDVSHASSRYTEGRLSSLAEELFSDINKDQVDSAIQDLANQLENIFKISVQTGVVDREHPVFEWK